MYVKLYNQILDSSIANDRRLRHFFTDLLLCSDPDGNVLMTDDAIARRTRADLKEVEWGLKELSKPDLGSGTQENEGRRIVPLEGHGYGWKILNYEYYRDVKSARQLREQTAERVRRFRERKSQEAALEIEKPRRRIRKCLVEESPTPKVDANGLPEPKWEKHAEKSKETSGMVMGPIAGMPVPDNDPEGLSEDELAERDYRK